MANRWFSLLMGVALVQGSLSFSPIPEMSMEEEWTQFAERIRNPAFRLPTTTRPQSYTVQMSIFLDVVPSPNIAPFSIDGLVNIVIGATESNVNEIVLHCNDMVINTVAVTYLDANQNTVDITAANQEFVCDPVLHFLRIRTTASLELARDYTVRSTYTARLHDDMRGPYRSWYRDSTGVRWMATTQFQPGHARRAFPCYDEPGFKATFDFIISRDSSMSPTISNMPISATSAAVAGRTTETFYTTPVTSTYLLAFIVSNYIVVSSGTEVGRPFNIYARNNIGTDGDWSLDVGKRLLAEMEAYTQIPYYEMAANMDMKQAAIPDFSAGAMENWGLLTYREALILYDPAKSNHFYKQRVANIVSHEIAHMWFGNLVTCAWWDNLWLNEGFARFYQYYLTGSVEPDLGYDTRFIVEQVHVAMLSDSVDNAHALTDPTVTDPVSVSAHFSTITYARGAAVLRMTQHLLGIPTFIKGLRTYLRDRSYDVAEPHHLFTALDNAAAEDLALATYNGITIDEYFKTWSEKAGHPLVTVNIDQSTGRMTVVQSRWERTSGLSARPSLWHIPITWTRRNASDFVDLKPTRFVTAQISTIERGTSGLEWVIFNKQQSGFYRVNYDDTNWSLLTRALRSAERTSIHEFNRAQIIDDLFAFGRANVTAYERVFNIISFLEFEDEYAPWIAAITGYNWLLRRLAHDADSTAKLKEIILKNSDAVVTRLGFSEPTGEAYMPSLQRMYVNQFLCNVGHEQCITAAVQSFTTWRAGGVVVPNLRPWVYCAGLRAGDAAAFDYFWSRYLVEDHASEQVVMLQAAGCTLNEASLIRFWEVITAPTSSTPVIRPQDSSTALSSAITANEENTMRSFNWLTNNVERTRDSIGLASPLNTIISRLLNEQQISQVNTWLVANQALLGESVYNTGVNAIATARANIEWYNQRIPEFNNYFETGYVDDDIDDITDTTLAPTTVAPTVAPTTEATTAEPTTAEPDSANVAALSFVTLVITLCINFLA